MASAFVSGDANSANPRLESSEKPAANTRFRCFMIIQFDLKKVLRTQELPTITYPYLPVVSSSHSIAKPREAS